MAWKRFLAFLIALLAASPAQCIVVNGQLQKAQAENLTGDPTGADGRFYYNTSTDLFKWYDLTTTTWRVAVDTTTSQTLTNKTMGSTNTLTGATAASFSNTGTITLPTGTRTLVGRDTTDTLTAKDYDGGTASNSSRLTIPKAAKSTIDGLTRKEATVLYASDEDKLYVDDGATLTEVGSGSGSSGLNNLVTNGNAEQTAVPAAWTTYDDAAAAAPVNGTGGSPSQITAIARNTTAGQLIYGSGVWKLVKAAADAQGEGWAYDFTLPAKSQLYSSLVTLSFDYYMSTAAVSDVLRVYLYDRDNAALITPAFVTCGGGSTPTLTPTTTACHAELSWVSTTADDYRLIFHVASASTTAVDTYVDNIYTGEYKAAVGAASGPPTSVTMTGSWSANTTYTATETREGEWASYVVQVKTTGAPTTAELSINLPTGRTINTGALPNALASTGWVLPNSTASILDSGTQVYGGTVAYGTTTSVVVIYCDDAAAGVACNSAVSQAAPMTWANNDRVTLSFRVPIAEWAGASSFGQNVVQYCYNTAGTTAAGGSGAAASTVCGPSGVAIGAIASTTVDDDTSFVVRFPSIVQATDQVLVEINDGTNVGWVPAASYFSRVIQGTSRYGIRVDPQATATDVLVRFGNKGAYPSNASYAGNGDTWTTYGSFKWRAKKFAGGQAVGMGLASTSLPGLVTLGDTVSAYQNATQALTAANLAPVLFTTELVDSTGAFASSTYTATVAGNYRAQFCGFIQKTSGTSTASDAFNVRIRKGGSQISRDLQIDAATSLLPVPFCQEVMVPMVVGNTLDASLQANFGGGRTYGGTLDGATFTVNRVQ